MKSIIIKTQHTIFISKTIGSVSAEAVVPKDMKALLTLAHGAGAGMNHPFMVSLADELAVHSIGTIRFNFPFIEQKKMRPDFPAIAHQTIASVVEFAKQHYSSTPVFLSGKSFGGRMSSQLLSLAFHYIRQVSHLLSGLFIYMR